MTAPPSWKLSAQARPAAMSREEGRARDPEQAVPLSYRKEKGRIPRGHGWGNGGEGRPQSPSRSPPPAQQSWGSPMLLFLRMGTGRFSSACLVPWPPWALRLVSRGSSAPAGRNRS